MLRTGLARCRLSSVDKTTRVTRIWGVAYNACRVEEALYRFEDGGTLDHDDRERFKLIAEFFQRALDGFSVMKALIDDREAPQFPDRARRLDDFRYAMRVLPEDVADPEASLAASRNVALAFADGRAEPEMLEPMRINAQRIRELASGVTNEIRTGIA